jgi:hypothetical protein
VLGRQVKLYKKEVTFPGGKFFLLIFPYYIQIPLHMRKIVLLASLLLLFGAGAGMAANSDLFGYDAVTIENQMAELDQLEGYLLENPGTTLGMMVSEGNSLAAFVGNTNGIDGISLVNEKVLGIPGFVWGCCLSWVGILVVYLVGKDQHETKQAIIGCVVGSLLGIGTTVVANILGAFQNFNY